MKNNKKKIIQVLLVLFTIFLTLNQSIIISMSKVGYSTLKTADTLIATDIILLDNPGKMLDWNKTGNISAKLISSKNEPIINSMLELWINENQEFEFVGVSITDEKGIGNFTFLVDYLNGDYEYKIRFEGDLLYSASEKESFFTVINDPPEAGWYNPGLYVRDFHATDRGIEFRAGIVSKPHAPIPKDYEWRGGITRYTLRVYTSNPSYPYTYTYYTDDSDYIFSGGFYISFTPPPEPGEITQPSLGSGIWRPPIEYLTPVDENNVPVGDAVHISELFDRGFENVTIDLSAWAEYEIKVFSFLWFPISGFSELTRVRKLIDDDPSPPIHGLDVSFDPSVTLNTIGPYNISFNFQDQSGWEGYIEYRFKNGTEVRGPFGGVNTDGFAGATLSTLKFTMKFGIPKSVWSKYPGMWIEFRTKAIDFDEDNGRAHDISESDWSPWIKAGSIFGKIGASIDSICTDAMVKVYNNWRWNKILINPEGIEMYKRFYLNDVNYINISIANPTISNLTINYVTLGFSCATFTTEEFLKISNITRVYPYKSFNVTKYSVERLEFGVKFEPQHFLMNQFDLDEIVIEFKFQYEFESQIYDYSTRSIYTITKPPPPTIRFSQYIGPFTYKTGNAGSKHKVEFIVENFARIPIKIYQELLFADSIVGTALEDKLGIYPSGIFEIPINPGEHPIRFNTKVLDTSFFSSEDDLLKATSSVFEFLGLSIETVNLILEIKGLIEAGSTIFNIVATVSVGIQAALAVYHDVIDFLAHQTKDQDMERIYQFKSNFRWNYIHNNGLDETTYNTLGYNTLHPHLTDLVLTPSASQINYFNAGSNLRQATAIGFAAVAVLSGIGYFNPFVKIVAIAAAIGCLVMEKTSDHNWNLANDDLPLNPKYNETYIPEYSTINMTGYEQTNELEESIIDLGITCLKLQEDFIAVNETKSRKQTAILVGDYDSALMQNEVLLNYTENLSHDYEVLRNDLEVMNYQVQTNATELQSLIINSESEYSVNGLSDEDINELTLAGYNSSQIYQLNKTLVQNAKNNTLSSKMPSMINNFSASLDETGDAINGIKNDLDKMSYEIVNDSINIKVEYLNESTSKADNQTVIELFNLKWLINELFLQGEWNSVIENADILINLAKQTSLSTNNNSYFREFGDFAEEKKSNALEYLKLSLYHNKLVIIPENDCKNITLLAHSYGAPTANYVLETNVSWVFPTDQIIPITQYQKTSVELSVNTDNISPDVYHINLRLYLPQTKTIINSLLEISVLDDDPSSPEILVDYTGSYLDADSGVLQVNISDEESGLSETHILINGVDHIFEQNLAGIPLKYYEIPISNQLGIYDIEIIARNSDNDWVGDQEFTHTSEIIAITDDDTTPPEITIVYDGNNCDSNPGTFEWNIFDFDSGISEINIIISYESTEGLNDYTITPVGTETGSWYLPPYLGFYTIEISVRDNDDDRTLMIDSLTTELAQEKEIKDDDIKSPELSNLTIIPDFLKINISFNAIDESGVGIISIFINGELIKPLTQVNYGNTYLSILENQWAFETGICEVIIQVKDGDNDRTNDALVSSLTGTFKNVLFDMYEYVNWQIEELKAYIDENLSSKKDQYLNWKLSKVQQYLNEALTLVKNGEITCALYRNKIAKVFVQITKFRTEILNKHRRLSDEHAEYIINALHDIRNNIVILMGASISTEHAISVAYIEVDLLDLSDFIVQEDDSSTGRYLSKKVWFASEMLEIALFKISIDEDIESVLKCVQWELKRVIWKINWYLNKGRISDDLASYIIGEIIRVIEALEEILIT